MKFANKVAVVTGGSRGIGFQVARKFESEGANVVILDLNQSIGLLLDNYSDSVDHIRSLKEDVSAKKVPPILAYERRICDESINCRKRWFGSDPRNARTPM
jgi:NAD(P)-dependent dehydrogenase (short-subunit alcohol dehydrogenase family)